VYTRTNYPVKPHRLTSVPADHRFGRGILGSVPAHRLPCTIADAEWASRLFAERATGPEIDAAEDAYNEILEMRYLESAMLDRYTNGWL
jgi:hypothetical protein